MKRVESPPAIDSVPANPIGGIQFIPVAGQRLVEALEERRDLRFVGTNEGMQDLGEERENYIVITMREVEPTVREDPVVVPVVVVHAVLPDVSMRIAIPRIRARQAAQIVEAPKEVRLLETARPTQP